MRNTPLPVSLFVSEPVGGLTVEAVLVLLLGPYQGAVLLGRPPGELAIGIDLLRTTGVSDRQFAGLVEAGLVEHRVESARPGARQRCSGAALRSPAFDERSRFALTPAGAALAGCILEGRGHEGGRRHEGWGGGNCTSEKPCWQARTRVLMFRGEIVKRFRRLAPNQQCILSAFEEMGWPPRMDDPLPRDAEVDALQRLEDTVKSLNRLQVHALIHFAAEADRQGVRWEASGAADRIAP